jgi:hypothetical protein
MDVVAPCRITFNKNPRGPHHHAQAGNGLVGIHVIGSRLLTAPPPSGAG